MTQEIHAHKVLNMLAAQAMSESDLRQAVTAEFGQQARFHTCSLNGFNLDALLVFFKTHEKIVEQDGKWMLNQARVCSH
ncbi:YecH family metal-binding protein [Vibrio sp.]|uniref:YecH family metal-binding protein n=1 Tax=Vibrio sp. TaxID=678 RepID=UPI003D144E3B